MVGQGSRSQVTDEKKNEPGSFPGQLSLRNGGPGLWAGLQTPGRPAVGRRGSVGRPATTGRAPGLYTAVYGDASRRKSGDSQAGFG